MKIKIIDDENEFYTLKNVWKSIYKCNTNKIFLSWEWASSWWQSIGRKKARMFKGLENNKTIVYATKPKTKLQIM